MKETIQILNIIFLETNHEFFVTTQRKKIEHGRHR